ncbi:MAG TPA: hypothetical protein VGM60_23795 [Pseudonocardia sp.]|jgi:hypothetical protein|uniref:hypothetical protein n=1 Tax=Pseudonocardia sp. TaxID=60912 RepID=UPI002F3E85A8
MKPDRVNDLMVLSLLLLDTVVLALLELTFASWAIGAIPVPLSALVALLSTPWLVRRAGELSKGVLGAALPLIAWAVVVCGMGVTGPGGDVLLTAEWPSLLLIAAGLVPGAYVLGKVIRTKRGLDA